MSDKEEPEEWQPEKEEDSSDAETEDLEKPKKPANARSSYKDGSEDKLLERLKEYFDENGVEFAEGWRIEIKQRTGGSSAGTSDAYYYSPAGKRYRSRAEIARDFNFPDAKPKAARGGGGGKSRGGSSKLTKENAYKKAQERLAAIELPLKLENGVTVTNFGRIYPHDGYVADDEIFPIDYTCHWTDEKGVRFTQTISISALGPVFSIKAADASSPESPNEPVVGAGHSPEEAWTTAAERQQEVMEIALVQRKKTGEEDEEEREMDAGDKLLVKAAPVGTLWADERFGLMDAKVLQAFEGLDKVDETEYEFVEQRNSWDAEEKKIAKEIAKHGKAPRKLSAIPRPRPRTQAERDELSIRKMLDTMIRQIELGELRANASEQKAALKKNKHLKKLLEKEERRLAKEREKEMLRKATEAQRQQWLAEQRMRAEAERTFDDETLVTANIALPTPPRVTPGNLPASFEPWLVEIWQFLNRFSGLLHLENAIPRIDELAAALTSAKPAPAPPVAGDNAAARKLDAASAVCIALLDYLVSDLYQNTLDQMKEENPDIKEDSLKLPNKMTHPIVLNEETWPEMARRLFVLLAATSAEQTKKNAQGLSYPLAVLEPSVVMQYLTAGPPAVFAEGPAFLPDTAADIAVLGLFSNMDAKAVTSAQHTCLPHAAPENGELLSKLFRCLLWQLASLEDSEENDVGRALWFSGFKAAAVAKAGRQLDLRSIASRVDSGLYLCAENPMEAFADDVRYALGLFKMGCKSGNFGKDMAGIGGGDAAVLALSFLEAALTEIEKEGQQAYLDLHMPLEPVEGAAKKDPSQEAVIRALHDLGRPFIPVFGCSVCWSKIDTQHLLECDTCGMECHTYCTQPALEDVPSGAWLCKRCTQESGMDVDVPSNIEFAHNSNGEDYFALATLLNEKDYSSMSTQQRMDVMQTLFSLVADSHALHDRLQEEEDEMKEKRKELHALKADLKKRQAEQAAAAAADTAADAAQPGVPGAEGEAKKVEDEASKPTRVTRRHDADNLDAAELENIVKNISRLEHELTLFQPQRLNPLATDRHWNRYWLVPGEALIDSPVPPPPVLLVERQRNESVKPGAAPNDPSVPQQPGQDDWQIGMYRSINELDTLLTWLNSRGTREKLLLFEVRKLRQQYLEHLQKMNAVQPPQQQQQEQPAEGVKTRVERLREALLGFEIGITGAARNGIWATDERLEAWRVAVAKAESPAEFMASLVALETAITPDLMRPYWMFWSMPAPLPEATGTLSAVWLRLEALKVASKNAVRIKITAQARQALESAQRPEYALRREQQKQNEKARPQRKRWWVSRTDSGDDSEREDSRANKRVKGGDSYPPSEAEDDEALALRLNAELNGPQRPTRSRLAVTSSARPGGRAAHVKGKYAETSETAEEDMEQDDVPVSPADEPAGHEQAAAAAAPPAEAPPQQATAPPSEKEADQPMKDA